MLSHWLVAMNREDAEPRPHPLSSMSSISITSTPANSSCRARGRREGDTEAR